MKKLSEFSYFIHNFFISHANCGNNEILLSADEAGCARTRQSQLCTVPPYFSDDNGAASDLRRGGDSLGGDRGRSFPIAFNVKEDDARKTITDYARVIVLFVG